MVTTTRRRLGRMLAGAVIALVTLVVAGMLTSLMEAAAKIRGWRELPQLGRW